MLSPIVRGGSLSILPLHGLNQADLGYTQIVFGATSALSSDALMATTNAKNRELMQDFLAATFEGWQDAMRDPKVAATAVQETIRLHPHASIGNDSDLTGSTWYHIVKILREKTFLREVQMCELRCKR